MQLCRKVFHRLVVNMLCQVQLVSTILLNLVGTRDVPSCDWNLNTPARKIMFQMAKESEMRK